MLSLIRYQLLAQRRAQAARRVNSDLLRRVLTAPVDVRTSWQEHDYLAVDIETTGLDPGTDQVVSFGWVPIVKTRIQVNQAVHLLVKTDARINESATVHGIRHQDMIQGIGIQRALERLLGALQGRVLLVHYRGLDKVLLDRLCEERYGARLWVPVVDTLALAQRRYADEAARPGQFRLFELCERFGLPNCRQHDALNDALATAQLFLALVSRTRRSEEKTLVQLLS